MGSDGKNNVKEQPVAVGLSEKAFTKALSYVPNSKALEKFRRLREKGRDSRIKEYAERKLEKPDKWLVKALKTLDADVADEVTIKEMAIEDTSAEVKNILESGSDMEKKDELRFHILRSLLSQKGFKENFKTWKGEYKEKSAMPDFKMSEEDYVYERGAEKIRTDRDVIIRGRISLWLKTSGLKEEDKDVKEKSNKELDEAVFSFLKVNEGKLLSEKSNKNLLRKQFVQIFLDHGCAEEDIKGLEGLFDEILGDIEYAAVMQQAYSDSCERMIAMSGQEMTDEEWDQQVMKELEAKAKGDVKEAIKEMVEQRWGAPTGTVKTSEVSYDSVPGIASANAVNIRSEGGDLFSIRFPSLGPAYQPKMRIVFPNDINDFNKANYIIEDEFADENAPNPSVEIREGKRAVAYKVGDLPKVLARIQLDYRLHKAAQKAGDSSITPAEVNKVLPDGRLIKMSERLFDLTIGKQPILPQHMSKYKNFLSVLLKKDGENSLVDRAKDMELALNDDGLVPYIRENLKGRAASEIFTVSKLLEMARLDMANGKNKKKKKREE